MADNLNISPDMIDNLINMLKNSNQSTETSDSSNNNQSNENPTDFNTSNLNNNIDFETILKIKSIIENLNNTNNQDSKLLYSLKPYLRKSRQAKLDQYVNILKITQISKLFNKKGDDA